MSRSAGLGLAFFGLFRLLSAACETTAPPPSAGALTSDPTTGAVVGKPTRSSATAAIWAVVDKDTCTSVEIEKSAKRDAIGGRRRSHQPLIKKSRFHRRGGEQLRDLREEGLEVGRWGRLAIAAIRG